MVLQLSAANAADVDEIAAVHLAAFDSNILLHAQFPTPASLNALRSYLSQEILASIQGGEQSRKAILVVRDAEADEKIISFAKWDLPGLVPELQTLQAPEITCVEGCNMEYLERYIEKAEAAKTRVISNTACYRKTESFIAPPILGIPAHFSSGELLPNVVQVLQRFL